MLIRINWIVLPSLLAALLGALVYTFFSGEGDLRAQSRKAVNLSPRWVSIFNGKDLKGWKIIGKEKWSVDNGTILGESGPEKGDGFLKTEKTYKNFHASLRFKCESNTNSGFFFHSDIEEDLSKIKFIQVEIDNRIGNHTGGLHGHGRSWIVWPAPENESALRPFDWNDLLVRVEGNRVRTRLNGVQMIDFTYPNMDPLEGVVALQIHPGGGARFRFKDIWIRDLSAPE